MSSFVRLIFVVVMLGIAASLTLVLASNARSARQQRAQVAAEKQRFDAFIQRVDGHERHAEMAVEWQKLDSEGNVTQSALLIRQYTPGANGPEPLPIERVIVPGNEVRVDGVLMSFGPAFSDDYADLRGTTLAFFDHVYGASQERPERFRFLTPNMVPAAAQTRASGTTHYELHLWRYLWELIQNPSSDAAADFHIRWTAPAPCTVRRGVVYMLFVGNDGTSIVESDDRAILNNLVTEAETQPTSSQPD